MRYFGFLTFIIAVFLVAGPAAPARAQGNPAVTDIQKILDTEEGIRAKLDTHLIGQIKNMQSTSAEASTNDILETTLLRRETKIEDDQNMLVENHLRIEFLNEFISALETTGDPRADAPKVLLDLAHKDLLANVENQSESKTWLFEIYLSIAIRDIMEPSENFGDFVKRYIVYSSLHEPKSPAGFLKNRDYLGDDTARQKPAVKDTAETPDDTDVFADPHLKAQ